MRFLPEYIEFFRRYNNINSSLKSKGLARHDSFKIKKSILLNIVENFNKSLLMNEKYNLIIYNQPQIDNDNDIRNAVYDLITNIYENKCKFYNFDFNSNEIEVPYVFVKIDDHDNITYYYIKLTSIRNFINIFYGVYENFLNKSKHDEEVATYTSTIQYLKKFNFCKQLDLIKDHTVYEYIITEDLYNLFKINIIKNI